jgi:predicted nucleic acid-binding OB-fold protein
MAISKKLKLGSDSGGGVDIPVDGHIGSFIGVLHLGVQRNVYEGKESLVDSALLQFELQDVLTDKGTPVVVSKIVRVSMHPKAELPKIIGALGGNAEEGADLTELLGNPVQVDIGFNKAKTKKKVDKISKLNSRLLKEVKPLTANSYAILDVKDLTDEQKATFPEWIRKIVDARVQSGSETNSNNKDDLL